MGRRPARRPRGPRGGPERRRRDRRRARPDARPAAARRPPVGLGAQRRGAAGGAGARDRAGRPRGRERASRWSTWPSAPGSGPPASVSTRSWAPGSTTSPGMFRLEIGPLGLDDFRDLLPGRGGRVARGRARPPLHVATRSTTTSTCSCAPPRRRRSAGRRRERLGWAGLHAPTSRVRPQTPARRGAAASATPRPPDLPLSPLPPPMISKDVKRLLLKLNEHVTRALEGAAGLAVGRGHYEVTVEHLLLKLLEDGTGDAALALSRLGVEPGRVGKALQTAVEALPDRQRRAARVLAAAAGPDRAGLRGRVGPPRAGRGPLGRVPGGVPGERRLRHLARPRGDERGPRPTTCASASSTSSRGPTRTGRRGAGRAGGCPTRAAAARARRRSTSTRTR